MAVEIWLDAVAITGFISVCVTVSIVKYDHWHSIYLISETSPTVLTLSPVLKNTHTTNNETRNIDLVRDVSQHFSLAPRLKVSFTPMNAWLWSVSIITHQGEHKTKCRMSQTLLCVHHAGLMLSPMDLIALWLLCSASQPLQIPEILTC